MKHLLLARAVVPHLQPTRVVNTRHRNVVWWVRTEAAGWWETLEVGKSLSQPSRWSIYVCRSTPRQTTYGWSNVYTLLIETLSKTADVHTAPDRSSSLATPTASRVVPQTSFVNKQKYRSKPSERRVNRRQVELSEYD